MTVYYKCRKNYVKFDFACDQFGVTRDKIQWNNIFNARRREREDLDVEILMCM